MKVCVLMFNMSNDDLGGGIPPYVENLCHGLKEIGHKVRVIQAMWREEIKEPNFRDEDSELVPIGFGITLRKAAGQRVHFMAETKIQFPYKGRKNASALRERLRDFDVVICVNFPSFGDRHRREDSDWMEVLEHGRPQVGIIHDCHWKRFYPWLLNVRHCFKALLAVHPGSLGVIRTFPGMVGCVVNPFDTTIGDREFPEKHLKRLGMTSFFKKWKHNDDGLRAAPFITPISIHCIGGGIELYNLRAELKSRDEYMGKYYGTYKAKIRGYEWSKNDPSVKRDWVGRRIYDVAMESGNFHHDGVRAGSEVSRFQAKCGGLVDFAYHFKWGEHFNRVLVEAMLHHCIPFARPFGISDNAEGQGIVFGRDNVVLIPEDASPRRIAEIIKDAMLDKSLRKDLVPRNVNRVKAIFDRKEVAKDLIAAAQGETKVGLVKITEGHPDKKVIKLMEKMDAMYRFPRHYRFPRLRK